MNTKDTFYREQTFKLLMEELKSHGVALKSFETKVDTKLDNLDKRADALERQMSKILGWASGAGAVMGLVFAYIKEKIFNQT